MEKIVATWTSGGGAEREEWIQGAEEDDAVFTARWSSDLATKIQAAPLDPGTALSAVSSVVT